MKTISRSLFKLQPYQARKILVDRVGCASYYNLYNDESPVYR